MMPVYVRLNNQDQWRRYPDDIDNDYFTAMLEQDNLEFEWRPFGIRTTPSDPPVYHPPTTDKGT